MGRAKRAKGAKKAKKAAAPVAKPATEAPRAEDASDGEGDGLRLAKDDARRDDAASPYRLCGGRMGAVMSGDAKKLSKPEGRGIAIIAVEMASVGFGVDHPMVQKGLKMAEKLGIALGDVVDVSSRQSEDAMEALVRMVSYGKPAVQAKLVSLRYCCQALRRMHSFPAGWGHGCATKSRHAKTKLKVLAKFISTAQKYKDPKTRSTASRWEGFGTREVTWAELWEIVLHRRYRSPQHKYFIQTTSQVAGKGKVWMNDEWFVRHDFPFRR